MALFFTSCKAQEIPTKRKLYSGLIVSCDSIIKHIVTDSVILLRNVGEIYTKKCKDCKLQDCPMKPKCYDTISIWPGIMTLDFKQNIYVFNYYVGNLKRDDINVNSNFGYIGGPMVHSKKDKSVTFTFPFIKNLPLPYYHRTFSYKYSKKTKTLTLIAKNSY